MRSAQLFAPGDLRIVEMPTPEPEAGQVLVRVMAYSPYGTDVGTYLNKGGRYVSEYPVGIGADFSGIVEKCGPGVDNVQRGDRVSALALDHCGTCANCCEGRTNLCLDPEFQTFVRQTACEEFTLVSACKLARLPDAVSFEEAAMLAGPVDALNGFEQMGLNAGDEVTILGVGAMGLGAIATAKALGLRTIAVGGSGKRAELAKRMGADEVHPIPHHGYDVAADLLANDKSAAAILETTASAWGIEQSFKLAAPGGAIALTGGPDLPATAWTLVERELRLYGVKAGAGQAKILSLIAEGKLDLASGISRRFDFEEANDALALLASDEARNVGRVIIRIGEYENAKETPS